VFTKLRITDDIVTVSAMLSGPFMREVMSVQDALDLLMG
jgi:hypothetical protein